MNETVKRLSKWVKGEKAGPISIHLDLTNRCNQKCTFCWQRSHEKMGLLDLKNELSDKKLLSIIDEAAALEVKDWLISGGGEPMLRTKLCVNIMKKIKSYGMFGDIITNGTFLNDENIKELVNVGWDRIRFSLNADNKEIHDSLTQLEGSFDKVIENARLINKYKKIYKKDVPELGFNTVITSKNYMRIPALIKLLKKLGGNLINFQTLILYEKSSKEYGLTKEQQKDLKRYISKGIKLARRYRIHTNLSNYSDSELVKSSNEVAKMDTLMKKEKKEGFLNTHCYEPWYLMTIRANGIVGSCRLFGDSGVTLHNKSLKDVWFGEYFKKARKKQVSLEIPDFCKNCGVNEMIENKRIRSELNKLTQDS
jgi:MoaA/NifB/PqqE/SkfB family radical SAM enzyme